MIFLILSNKDIRNLCMEEVATWCAFYVGLKVYGVKFCVAYCRTGAVACDPESDVTKLR
jgi:hypothetical protein